MEQVKKIKIAPRKLPIGIQDFKYLRENNFIYVDKTQFIWDLSTNGKPYFLSRPRRFGKSLLISTMAYYFSGERELFDGLAIQSLEDEKEDAWIKHPVFHFDLNAKKYNEEKDLFEMLDNQLQKYEQEYDLKIDCKDPDIRLKNLIEKAYSNTGNLVVVLIDEYDKPLIATQIIRPELNNKYRETLKGFYGVLKSCDKYLRFVFLTGISRFSKVSIFSDLNQLINISMDDDYHDICGITEKELVQCFGQELETFKERNKFDKQTAIAELKRYYDGYKFSEGGSRLFNPFSLLNSLAKRKLENYWYETGTPTFLMNLIKESDFEIKDFEETEPIDMEALKNSEPIPQNPIPIFFQTGYLTIKSYDSRFQSYTLTYPNQEVRYAFMNNLFKEYITKSSDTIFFIKNFIEDIESKQVDSFMERFCSLIASIPYSPTNPSGKQLREVDYQRFFYIIFSLMGRFIQCEVPNIKGRSDAVVEIEDTIYIFEFKLFNNATPEQAIEQIKTKGYAEPYRAKEKNIIAVGVAFNETENPVGQWDIVEV